MDPANAAKADADSPRKAIAVKKDAVVAEVV
jgi:hypothetical protein